MTTADLLPLLLGGTGALVLSLVLNYSFWKGWLVNPKRTVLTEQYERLLKIVDRNTAAVERIEKRMPGRKT